MATIIGTKPFESLAEKGFPVAVSGFEPGDILLGINLLQLQAEEGISRVDNGYPRAVKPDGNQIALKIMKEVFETSDSEWRGIGKIENSGLVLRKEFEEKDAAKKHGAVLHGCRIENNVLIGMNSTILNGAEIGRNSIVGANALISEGKKFPENSLIIGVPGKVKRETEKSEIEAITENAAEYVEFVKEYREEVKNMQKK